jgi:hypothetical protein
VAGERERVGVSGGVSVGGKGVGRRLRMDEGGAAGGIVCGGWEGSEIEGWE